MKTLGQARLVIVVLSEKYLRSPYCMTELYSIYQNARQERQEFLNRIIPMVLKDAKIGNWRARAVHAKHWETEFKAMEQDIPHLGQEDLKLYKAMRRWHNEVGDMLAYVNDVLSPRPPIASPPTRLFTPGAIPGSPVLPALAPAGCPASAPNRDGWP
jgi:internalin A